MDFAKPDAVSEKALRSRFGNARDQGFPLNPDTLPKRVRWQGAQKRTPDILPWFVVSERFRELVEKLEPETHQFVPVEVWRDKKGDRVEQYYWFNVCQRLDSVNRQNTTYMWEASGKSETEGFWTDALLDTKTFQFTSIPDAKLVFDTRKIHGHHIWCDPHILTFGERLCSDSFAKAAERAAIVGLVCSEREEG